jgi:hypothetical protein
MISVITPTVRPLGLKIVADCLARQTFKDFEWVIVAPRGILSKELFSTFPPLKVRVVETPGKGDAYWSLNRDYNAAIRRSRGSLIVSWQDYTWADDDALEKFSTLFKTYPHALVSGVGDKYSDQEKSETLWRDPRRTTEYGTFYPCNFSDIEWNFCSIPRNALLEVGGFDEALDFLGFGMDAYSVNHRIAMTGAYDTYLAQDIESYSLAHGRPFGWEENNLIHGGYKARVEYLQKTGRWPVIGDLQSSEYPSYDVTHELYPTRNS